MFSIDLTSRIPIYEQIHDNIISLIVKGTLSENDQLPSVRALAKNTGVNPNTVAKAYQELERNGIIYSVPGRGSFIAKPDSSVYQSAVLSDFDKAADASGTESRRTRRSPRMCGLHELFSGDMRRNRGIAYL